MIVTAAKNAKIVLMKSVKTVHVTLPTQGVNNV